MLYPDQQILANGMIFKRKINHRQWLIGYQFYIFYASIEKAIVKMLLYLIQCFKKKDFKIISTIIIKYGNKNLFLIPSV